MIKSIQKLAVWFNNATAWNINSLLNASAPLTVLGWWIVMSWHPICQLFLKVLQKNMLDIEYGRVTYIFQLVHDYNSLPAVFLQDSKTTAAATTCDLIFTHSIL